MNSVPYSVDLRPLPNESKIKSIVKKGRLLLYFGGIADFPVCDQSALTICGWFGGIDPVTAQGQSPHELCVAVVLRVRGHEGAPLEKESEKRRHEG